MGAISIQEHSQDTDVLKADIMKDIEDTDTKGLARWDSFFNAHAVVHITRSAVDTAPVAINLSTIRAHVAIAL